MSPTHTILHVEDDFLVSRAVSRALRRSGFEVASAESCVSARGLDGPFPYGVFDIDLTDGDGVSVALELLGRGTVGQVCFFTASVDLEAESQARALGPVFRKSAGLSYLLQHLRDAGSARKGLVGGLRKSEPPPKSTSRPGKISPNSAGNLGLCKTSALSRALAKGA